MQQGSMAASLWVRVRICVFVFSAPFCQDWRKRSHLLMRERYGVEKGSSDSSACSRRECPNKPGRNFAQRGCQRIGELHSPPGCDSSKFILAPQESGPFFSLCSLLIAVRLRMAERHCHAHGDGLGTAVIGQSELQRWDQRV